jgi:hypothetical protein
MFKHLTLLLTLLSILMLTDTGFSQTADFQLANRLMQQQNYDEARPILRDLHQNNPGAYVFFDRYVECLIGLNELEEAELVARRQMESPHAVTQTSVKLAEIVHMRGEREEAGTLWYQILERNPENIQIYYSVAASMNNRREYLKAIDVYKLARQRLNNPTLFLTDLANTYMQAGLFEESVKEYYRLVIESPEQMSIVQQRFLRMRDDRLYEVAAFELEDMLFELDHSHPAYSQLYQLLGWLLLETEEYQRAINFARHYESQTQYTIYSLFSLGTQLISASQYEYAAEAYRYYVESDSGSNRMRAMEELARTYQAWSQYLQQHNLDTDRRHRQLNEQAYELGRDLLEEYPGYERANRVYTMLIDLSLDEFKDIDQAAHWLDLLKNDPVNDQAYILYAEGRISLFKKDFITARQLLTRSDRATDSSNLSERARYYLSLTDFFAGDYEFAEIQLRSLERRHTSFYANDAIKLRMWIKNGQRADTTGSVLKAIGEGQYAVHTGDYLGALPLFEPILANAHNPFADNLTVELSSLLPSDYNHLKYLLLERQINARPYSPLLERMMWDRAVLSEQIYQSGGMTVMDEPPYLFSFFRSGDSAGRDLTSEERFFQNMNTETGNSQLQSYSDFDLEYVSNLFEEIIVQFPDGFYATFAREKLQTIESTIL